MAKLDRTRPYGTIHGGSTGACFEQDHKEFDNEGNEMARAKVAPKPAAAPVGPDMAVAKDSQGNLFKDGEILDTEDMDAESLHALAKDMGLKLHPKTGKSKVLAAILEAAAPVDQLSQQLQD